MVTGSVNGFPINEKKSIKAWTQSVEGFLINCLVGMEQQSLTRVTEGFAVLPPSRHHSDCELFHYLLVSLNDGIIHVAKVGLRTQFLNGLECQEGGDFRQGTAVHVSEGGTQNLLSNLLSSCL
jgi:hypothetical protein